MSKKDDIYPSTQDAWRLIIGIDLLLISLALFVFSFSQGDSISNASFITIIAGFVIAGIASFLIDGPITNHITHYYGVSRRKQLFRWQSKNFDQGIGALSFKNISKSASIIGMKPIALRLMLSALGTLVIISFILGLYLS